MSVQVSTYIDEAKKQQFDEVCEVIGISPSNALSMFIENVINRKDVSLNETPPETRPKMSREEMFGCMRGLIDIPDDFDAPLEVKPGTRPKMSREEVFGCMRGHFEIPDDFDEPLEDFKEYME